MSKKLQSKKPRAARKAPSGAQTGKPRPPTVEQAKREVALSMENAKRMDEADRTVEQKA